MPEFAKINEFGMIENVIIADSLELAEEVTGETCYPVEGAGIGYILIAEENRFVSQAEYAEIMKPIWDEQIAATPEELRPASLIPEEPAVEE